MIRETVEDIRSDAIVIVKKRSFLVDLSPDHVPKARF